MQSELKYFKQLRERYIKLNRINTSTLNKLDLLIEHLEEKIDLCNCPICSK